MPPRIIPREIPELDTEDRGLDRIKPRIDASPSANITFPPTILANFMQRRGNSGIVGDNHAAIANRTEILGRIKAETPRVAKRARCSPVTARTVALRAILDQTQAMCSGELTERAQLGWLAVQVHRQHRGRPTLGQALQSPR